jgi:hypothetical protein
MRTKAFIQASLTVLVAAGCSSGVPSHAPLAMAPMACIVQAGEPPGSVAFTMP